MTKHLFALAALVLLLEGCAQPPPPVLAERDYNDGIAKSCNASSPDLAIAAPTATIAQSNDGWCAVRVIERDGRPFKLGLVKTRPTHGFVVIRSLGGVTRVEYTAENRYVGTDQFTVSLRPKADGAADLPLQVSVTTTMGEGMAPPAPAAAPAKPAPARRTTTRSRT